MPVKISDRSDRQVSDEAITKALSSGPGVTPSSPAIEAFLYQLAKDNTRDPQQLETLRYLYQVLTTELNSDQRTQFVFHIVEEVRTGTYSPDALLVVLEIETDPVCVRLLVATYLETETRGVEEFASVAQLMDIFENDQTANRGALHAAMVCFGDRRISATVRTRRDLLGIREARSFANTLSPPIHRSTVEYCFTWLLDLIQSGDTQMMEPVSSALGKLLIGNFGEEVHDRAFNFGLYGFKTYGEDLVTPVSDLKNELEPILVQLEQTGIPILERLVHTIRHLETATQEDLERRTQSSRRGKVGERRGGDRRVISLAPHIERRADQRRTNERRSRSRR